MSLEHIQDLARLHSLTNFGAFHTTPEDGFGPGTIVLLGPDEPGFWDHFTATPEYKDKAANPMDRWSTRVITQMAKDCGGEPLFPFGNPTRPFIGWALRSGQAFVSPASLLVHADVGLFVSYRGAIFLPDELPLPAPAANPCDTCADKPCLSACPPGAISEAGYDLPSCHAFLDSKDGEACMSQGCAVRRSCPLVRNYTRMDAHSAYHMKAFHL